MKVVYDGTCPVCVSLKELSESKISGKAVEFVPFQGINLEAEGISYQEARDSIFVVGSNGSTQRGAHAVFEIMKQMPGLWRTLGYVFALPPIAWIADPCYRLFARHRHKVSRIFL